MKIKDRGAVITWRHGRRCRPKSHGNRRLLQPAIPRNRADESAPSVASLFLVFYRLPSLSLSLSQGVIGFVSVYGGVFYLIYYYYAVGSMFLFLRGKIYCQFAGHRLLFPPLLRFSLSLSLTHCLPCLRGEL